MEAALSAGRIRSRLLIIWGVLVALIVLIVVVEQTSVGRVSSTGATASDPRLLVPVPVAQLGAIEVIDAGTVHRFERDAAGAWFYHGVHGASAAAHTHSADPSAAARIDRAVGAFGRTRIERRVGRERDVGAYGVTAPKVVILLYRPGATQPLAQYAVGDLAPDTVSRYVDVVGGASGVVTIPNYQIDNLLALVDSVAGSPNPRPSAGTTTSALPSR